MITDALPDPWDLPGELPGEVPVIEMIPEDEEGIRVGAADRDTLLSIASGLTTVREDAIAVAINASALLAWVEEAASFDDLRLRMDSVERHRINRQGRGRDSADLVMDDPAHFLAGAQVLYSFKIAGRLE